MFVVPPLTGHVNPTVAVGRELLRRGHEVAWVGHPGVVRPLLPQDATLHALDDRVPLALRSEMERRARATRGLAALKFLWEDFLLPLARSMVPGVEAAVDAVRPDLLVVDHQALAGALVARRRGCCWASFATTSASVVDALSELPRVRDWLDEQRATLQREAGLPAIADPDLSPHAVVVFSTRALVGDEETFPAHYHFVGPALSHRLDPTPFPFEAIAPARRRVLVSLGTVNAARGHRFYRAAVEALAPLEVQAVFAAPVDQVGPVPDHWIVRRWIPQLRVLPHMHAVIGHGGHNTTCEALSLGLPLVLAPIRDDQPVVARQVVAAGAGLRVRFGRVGPAELRRAVSRVLDEPGFSEAAARIRASFEAAGGAASAATILETLPCP
ncbi:MAG: glycosyltransferase [Deltaproteobacteria bacterium]|nr:MAG: glycosyltransferase [Deltaproteobacteria bacterium]